MNIKILDYTLRDDGYINNWEFPKIQTIKIAKSLSTSNIDIIELGYLDRNKGASNNSTLFDSTDSTDSVLSSIEISAQKVLMINFNYYKVNRFPRKSKTKIDCIQLGLHKKGIAQELPQAAKINNLNLYGFNNLSLTSVSKRYLENYKRL